MREYVEYFRNFLQVLIVITSSLLLEEQENDQFTLL